MSSSTMDVAALLQQMSSLGIPSRHIQAAMRNPAMLKEIMDEMLSRSSEEDTYLKELQRVQANAAQDRELGPAPSVTIPRSLFIISMMESRKKFEERFQSYKENSGHIQMRRAFVGTEKHYSDKPIGLLSRITLEDMLVRKVHRDKYLLCRVIIPPTRLVAIEAAIEDPEGDVRLLSLYNFPSMMNAGMEEIDAVFPVGTILAIREPYFKTSLQNAPPFIRVDSPSDVVFPDPSSYLVKEVTWKFGTLVPGSPRLPITVSGWKEAGNMHFKAARWLAAAVAYTKGLAIDPSAVVLQANRAETYLKLQRFSAALFDAENVLNSSHTPQEIRRKVLFRAGRAAYSKGVFEKAFGYFREALACSSDNIDANEWIRRTNSRIAETSFGRYDWLQLFLESQKANYALDVADYVGPVEVVSLPARGGGRGIVATRNIKVGELLIVAKPFAATFYEELPSYEAIVAVNIITKKMDEQCQFHTLSRTVDKIYGNPELHDLVCHLCPSPSYPAPPLSYPPPIHASETLEHPLKPGVDINIALLENICSNNMFKAEPLRYADFKPSKSQKQEMLDLQSPAGLYLLPSLFNHSCLQNASCIFFRDVMVIRARGNINKGEELTLSYASGDTTYTRHVWLDGYNFKCTCLLCESDRVDGEQACRRREELVESMASSDAAKDDSGFPLTAVSYGVTIESLELLIKQVLETYTSTNVTVRPALAAVQHRLAHELQVRAYDSHRLYYRAIVEEIKALEAAGIRVIDKSTSGRITRPRTGLPIHTDSGPQVVMTEFCVNMILMIVASFLSVSDHPRAGRWLRAAWWLEEVIVGGGRGLFEERYKKILQTTGISTWSDTILN